MKQGPDHWGSLCVGWGGPASSHRINVDAEIDESRAFTERLFRDYRGGGRQMLLMGFGAWTPLHRRSHDAQHH